MTASLRALRAIATSGNMLWEAPQECHMDRVVVLEAVALRYADQRLWADREVAKAACTQDGYVGFCAQEDPDVAADREVVLAAVRQAGGVLRHAAPDLRVDGEIVKVAMATRGVALEFADPALKDVIDKDCQ